MSTVKTPLQPATEPLPSYAELLKCKGDSERRIVQQDQRIALLDQQIEWLKEQLGLRNSAKFAPSSEATREPHPQLLFNEAESLYSPEVPEPTVETIGYHRVKRKGKREADLSGLPVEEIRHELAKSEQVCPQCCGQLHEIGEELRQELRIVPASATLVKHLKVKYGCRHCACHDTNAPVITAAMPAPAFPRSLASPSAMAFIMSQKYELALPLYRQEQYLQGLGLNLSRQTMANWVLRGTDLLKPLSHRMKTLLLELPILHADETTVQVLHENDRAATTKSFMWLYRSGRDGPPLVLYDYQITRGAIHPQRYLKGFEGFLHVDGYAGYENLPGVTLVGCWAHARRKFDEALRGLPSGARSTANTAAQEGLNFCNKLFKIDSELRGSTAQERYAVRNEQSAPLLRNFETWLEVQAPSVLPQSLLGKAITYCRNQWPKLQSFLLDGRLELDNNRSERSIKPFVIGRKNWLFSNTARGATASASVYGIIATAKENGLLPADYLEYLFEQLPAIDTADVAQLDMLLPWTGQTRARCLKHDRG